MLPSWTLTSWPSVRWCAPDDPRRWPAFQHMGTDIRAGGDEQGRTMGDTCWAARLPDGSLLGLAWEWVVVGAGIVVLRDPNGIISNARLEDETGEELPELRALCVVNGIACATPWQWTVVRRLGVAWAPARPVPPADASSPAAGPGNPGWPGRRPVPMLRAAKRA